MRLLILRSKLIDLNAYLEHSANPWDDDPELAGIVGELREAFNRASNNVVDPRPVLRVLNGNGSIPEALTEVDRSILAWEKIPAPKRVGPMTKAAFARRIGFKGSRPARFISGQIDAGFIRYEELNRSQGYFHADDLVELGPTSEDENP